MSSDWVQLVARLLMAQIFLGAGAVKLLDTAAITRQIAERADGPLVPLILAGAVTVELAGGLALLLGLRVGWVAVLLAAYVLVATSLYHTQFGQPFQADLFSKDIAIVGGLLLLAWLGAGRFSLDALLRHP